MRDILFRGKRIGDGEWVEGNLFVWVDGDTDIFVRDPGDSGCQLKFSVWPDSVSQYTGLTDKNGKKIFEGDIIGFCGSGYVYTGTVKYEKAAFCVSSGGVSFPLAAAINYDAEVIGNIHDNPELLGGADNG